MIAAARNSYHTKIGGYKVDRRPVVIKFGGTSVATRAAWEAVDEIVRGHLREGLRPVVVCSAVRGVTDKLLALVDLLAGGADDPAAPLAEIAAIHHRLGVALGVDADALLAPERASLAAACAAARPVTAAVRARILAHGELMSTRLGAAWLAGRRLDVERIDARELLRAGSGGDRDEHFLSARCTPGPTARERMARVTADVVVTQGFIAAGPDGETVLLGRGGSDASGAYLAADLGAAGLEIWTDVPGVFTADPRRFPDARMLRRLSYGEAEAVAALGAKVLHPRTIEPARVRGVPIRIGWTARPDLEGTCISRARPGRGPKAIVSRTNLALVTMWRPSSWQPVGFMAEVSARFGALGVSMDLIASSPSEIRATIDLGAFPSASSGMAGLLDSLAEVCRPRVVSPVASVSVVGAGVTLDLLAGWREAVSLHDLHMVSHAADGTHHTFVVDQAAEPALVAAAHADLLARGDDESTFGETWRALGDLPPASAEVSGRAPDPATLEVLEMSA